MSVKKLMYVKKIIIGILLHVTVKNGKKIASIMDDATIVTDEFIQSYHEVTPKNFQEKNVTCKTQNLYILLPVLLITTALLITVNIYCYLIK